MPGNDIEISDKILRQIGRQRAEQRVGDIRAEARR